MITGKDINLLIASGKVSYTDCRFFMQLNEHSLTCSYNIPDFIYVNLMKMRFWI